ncbi:MAG: proline dehydrogenase family protein [Bacteroidota bacterium]
MSLLNKLVVTALPIIPRSIIGQISKRYIAGITIHDAVRVIRGLNQKEMMATLDLLGEDIQEQREALENRSNIVGMFQEIQRSGLDSNVSVKLTQFGLRINKNLCYENVKTIVENARDLKNFVRIDMEDSTTTTETIEIFRRLREAGYDNVGLVLQAYMRRSEADIRSLAPLKPNIRLCKGIYIEHRDIAFKERDEIRKNFLHLLQLIVENGSYVGIATHDDYLVDKSYELIQEHSLKRHQFEFQMLLGVREQLRGEIVRRGHRLRVYVPYGEKWYAYSTRRLKENPQMAWYITRAMFGR